MPEQPDNDKYLRLLNTLYPSTKYYINLSLMTQSDKSSFVIAH